MTEQETFYFTQLLQALKEQRTKLDLMIVSLEGVLEFEESVRITSRKKEDGH